MVAKLNYVAPGGPKSCHCRGRSHFIGSIYRLARRTNLPQHAVDRDNIWQIRNWSRLNDDDTDRQGGGIGARGHRRRRSRDFASLPASPADLNPAGRLGIAFATMAHYEVQRALRINGHQRLTAAVGQVVSLLTQTSAVRVAEIDRIAADPLVGAIVTGTDPARLQTIPPGLRALVVRSPQAIISVYGSGGQPIASARAKSEAWESPAGCGAACRREDRHQPALPP